VSQSTIFRAKILAGLAAYSICVVPALILIAVYLEVKGPEQLPTAWTQVIPVALAAIGILALHPAAMWTACREARWVGTRLFPLVFAGTGVFVTSIWSVSVLSLMSFLGFVSVAVFVFALTLIAASHAFRHQTSDTLAPRQFSGPHVDDAFHGAVYRRCDPLLRWWNDCR
jgi:hypothetical protein